jgi:LysR family nitrogen assimilation transcriptional regulator
MEIKQLQNFEKIAELGNLTRAAGVLGLTQAALSRQVGQLEAELDVELFRRNGRGLVLTDAGKRLVEHAQVILRQVSRAQRAVKGPTGPVQGNLVLGLPPSLARTMVVPLIEAFQRELPEATLRTVDGLSSSMIELVGIGKLDCAVVYNSTASEAVNLGALADEDLFLVSGPMSTKLGKALGNTIALADIAPLPLISAGGLNAIHTALATALAAIGKSPTVVHEIANLNAILDLVRSGHGYAVIPLSGVRSCIGDAKIRLHRIRKPLLRCSLSIATPARVLSDALTDKTVALLREVVRRELLKFQKEVEEAVKG